MLESDFCSRAAIQRSGALTQVGRQTIVTVTRPSRELRHAAGRRQIGAALAPC
jgi:hypothetical protein